MYFSIKSKNMKTLKMQKSFLFSFILLYSMAANKHMDEIMLFKSKLSIFLQLSHQYGDPGFNPSCSRKPSGLKANRVKDASYNDLL